MIIQLFILTGTATWAPNIMLLLAMFMVFYFLLIRPQSKKAKAQQEFINNLTKNQRVITAGGIHGKIIKIDDGSVLLEVDTNTKIRVEKSTISLDHSAPEAESGK